MICDFNDQVINLVRVDNFTEPQVTGAHAGSTRNEKAQIKTLFCNLKSLLLVHNRGAVIERCQVVDRLGMTCPGATGSRPQPRVGDAPILTDHTCIADQTGLGNAIRCAAVLELLAYALAIAAGLDPAPRLFKVGPIE